VKYQEEFNKKMLLENDLQSMVKLRNTEKIAEYFDNLLKNSIS